MDMLKETRVTRDNVKYHLQAIPQGVSNDQLRQMIEMLNEMHQVLTLDVSPKKPTA
jgi:hypothetical protein